MPTSLRATLVVEGDSQQFDEQALHMIAKQDYRLLTWSSERKSIGAYRIEAVLQWEGHKQDAAQTPRLVGTLSGTEGVRSVAWKPAAMGS